MRSLVQPPSMN